MDWRLKSFIFRVVSTLPKSFLIISWLRKFGGRPMKKTVAINENWILHANVIRKYGCRGRLFEFGAGITLGQNLYLSMFFNSQIVFDLNPMFDPNLSNRTALMLHQIIKMPYYPIRNKIDLEKYNIVYIAGGDARRTDLKTSSVDYIASTNTFEHISKSDLEIICQELRRILSPDGIFCAKIDYTDHYSHTDSSLHCLNFLRYSEEEWSRYNHSFNYVNRLRHVDYRSMFEEAGFAIIEEKVDNFSFEFPVADCFSEYTTEELQSVKGVFVMRKI